MLRSISLFTFLIITCLHFSCETDVSGQASYHKSASEEQPFIQVPQLTQIEEISPDEIPHLQEVTESEQYQLFLEQFDLSESHFNKVYTNTEAYLYSISYQMDKSRAIELVLYPEEDSNNTYSECVSCVISSVSSWLCSYNPALCIGIPLVLCASLLID